MHCRRVKRRCVRTRVGKCVGTRALLPHPVVWRVHMPLRVCVRRPPAPPQTQHPLPPSLPLARRHTASRLPLLCSAQCLTALTLFGKSAAVVPHGHRLAVHLPAIAGLKQVRALRGVSVCVGDLLAVNGGGGGSNHPCPHAHWARARLCASAAAGHATAHTHLRAF